MYDQNERDAWVSDVYRQQDERLRPRPPIGTKQPQRVPMLITRLPGGCLLYRLDPRTSPCAS